MNIKDVCQTGPTFYSPFILIRNRTQTVVTNMRLNKLITEIHFLVT